MENPGAIAQPEDPVYLALQPLRESRVPKNRPLRSEALGRNDNGRTTKEYSI